MYPTSQDAIVAYATGPQGPAGDVSAAQLAAAIDALKAGVAAEGDTLAKLLALISARAKLDGAAFSNITVPTQSIGDDSERAASTAFVKATVGNSAANLQALAGKGQAEGYAGLDSNGKVPTEQLPDFAVSSVAGLTGAVAAPALRAALGSREVLTANRTYYVRTDGSNSNDGLANTSGRAFLTIPAAISAACALDLSIYAVTIQVADGTYTSGPALLPYVGIGPITLKGNTTTPASCLISPSGVCVNGAVRSGDWVIDGFKLTSSGGDLVFAGAGTSISLGHVEFGSSSGAHLSASGGGVIKLTSEYAISGGASRHVQLEAGAFIVTAGRAVTITGTPAFSTAFSNAVAGATHDARSMTFSGSATGKRYAATENGIIRVNGGGASYFPGDVAGTADRGGQYN